MFYDLFKSLCEEKGISVTKATVDIGLSRTIGTKWKQTAATPQGETLNKIADYFGVSVDYLLGNEQQKSSGTEPELDTNTLEYALYGEARELDEDEKQQLLELAKLMRKKRNEK